MIAVVSGCELQFWVEYQAKVLRRSARSLGGVRGGAGRLRIEPVDERVDETNRIFGANIVFTPHQEEAEAGNALALRSASLSSRYSNFGVWFFRTCIFTQSEVLFVDAKARSRGNR